MTQTSGSVQTPSEGPRRIQRKRTKGWRMPEGTISVSRPSRWGNPFKPGQRFLIYNTLGWGVRFGGENIGPDFATIYEDATVDQCVQWYRAWVLHSASRGHVDLNELRGRDLACWCPLDQPCHADVLLEIANA